MLTETVEEIETPSLAGDATRWESDAPAVARAHADATPDLESGPVELPTETAGVLVADTANQAVLGEDREAALARVRDDTAALEAELELPHDESWRQDATSMEVVELADMMDEHGAAGPLTAIDAPGTMKQAEFATQRTDAHASGEGLPSLQGPAQPPSDAQMIAAPATWAGPRSPQWEALAEDVRMQVLQRLDIFTDTALQAQLAERLQPIVDRASAEFVAAINQHVGQLLRAYVAEAIEREIDTWRGTGR